MRVGRKAAARLAGAFVFLVLAAGLIAPLLDVGRFGSRVRQSLRDALGREVEIGRVHLDLFNGPGFSVDDVVIHDDPRAGIEPFAYVESMSARVSFASFWTGRLEFSSLRLDNPSVNLVKPASGPWNFEGLLTRTVGTAPRGGARLPYLEVRGGRINFKFGDTKSVFYLTEAKLDVSPPDSSGEWRIRFEGQPARTDRPAHGFGVLLARGRWKPDTRTGGQLDFSVDVEKNSIGELVRLLHGHDIGVHGLVTSHARLSGPASDVRISGRMQLTDIHRWDLLPPHGEGWTVNYSGRLDLLAQTLDLATLPSPAGAPLAVRFRASNYLSRPRWSALATLDRLPLAPLPELGRHMGLAVPEALSLDGEMSGAVGYSPDSGMQGTMTAETATLNAPGAAPVRFEQPVIAFEGSRVSLARTPFRFGSGAGAPEMQAEYRRDAQALDVIIVGDGTPIPGADSIPAQLLAGVPLLADCRNGAWSGLVRYRQAGDGPGTWTGIAEVARAEIPVDGFAEPFELASGRVAFGEDGAVMDGIMGRIGGIDVRGEYRYRPGNARPHTFRFVLPAANAEELERLLMPALERSESLLARALRLGRSSKLPAWLESRHAEGMLQIGALALGDFRLDKVRAHIRWDGAAIELTDFGAGFGGGAIAGRLSATLRRAAPSYRGSARFRSVAWAGGEWDGRARIETAGTGPDVMRNLRLEGSFSGKSISLVADTEFKNFSGSYVVTLSGGLPLMRFSDLQATVGDDVYEGQGAAGPDGKLHFELTDGQRQMRMSGTLSPFQLDLVAARSPG